ncbi:MAG: hypothetical protein V1836_02375 [Candidatus Aenigmatarchaeota archaeon]
MELNFFRKSYEQRFTVRIAKGQMHMIEAIIAVSMILTFLILLRAKLTPVEDTGIEQALAFQALNSLDKGGLLRSYAINENYTGLDAEVNAVIPSEFSHAIRFCYLGERCIGGALPDKNIYTAAYVIAGNETNFKPVQVLLHMWR